MKHVPSYLEKAVVESGDTQAEVLLCQIEATEAQTQALERIAAALERDGCAALIAAIGQALECCQDGDHYGAAHILHAALVREASAGSAS